MHIKTFFCQPVLGLTILAMLVGLHPVWGQPPAVPLPPPKRVDDVLPPSRDHLSFRSVVKRVLPAVVSIEVKSQSAKAGAASPRRLPPNLPEEYRRYFESLPEAKADPNLGFGSGVLVDDTGTILTNFHVVDGADSVEVTLQDGRQFPSQEIRRDPKTDLAIILIKSEQPLPFLPLGDSSLMEVGDWVLAIGAPFGLTGSVSQGIVSAKSRQGLKLNQYEDFLQSDAAVNPGNSGGPLVNLLGEVVGINAAIKTRSGGFQGVGLAVSSNLARDVVQQLKTTGVVRRGFLGVGIRELDAGLAQKLNLNTTAGVVVSRVYPDSSAAKAGLQPGDIITSVAGTAIPDVATLPALVAKLPLNQPAEVMYLREGRLNLARVLVVEQPEEITRAKPASPAPAPAAGRLPTGLTIAELTAGQAAQLGFPAPVRGVLITAVQPGSPAANAGLTRGQVIIKLDRTPTPTIEAFQKALALVDPEAGAVVHLLRPNGEVSFVVLPLQKR